MGLHRIVLEGYTYEEAGITATRAAAVAARASGLSLTTPPVLIVHPGQEDEKTVTVPLEG